ncbi:MAG: hypothetical protein K1X75_11960 [Leptospirales bacterium]|nr:hypothetical protein [Leptospirales bacterium]
MRQLLQERNYVQALQRAQAYLKLKPEHVALLSIAASAAYGLGRFEDALHYVLRARTKQPESSLLKESEARIRRRLQGGK